MKIKVIMFALIVGIIYSIGGVLTFLLHNDNNMFTFYASGGSFDATGYAIKIHYFAITNQLPSIYCFQDAIITIIFGTINKIVSVDYIFIFGSLIFLPILFIVLYYLSIEFGLSENHSVLSALSIISLSHLINFIPTIHPERMLIEFYNGFPTYQVRFPQTVVSGILFFLTFILLYRIIFSNKKIGILVGFLSGIMMYTYFYYGSFLLMLSIVYAIISVKNTTVFKELLKALFIAILMTLPAIYISIGAPEWIKEITEVQLYSLSFDYVFSTIKLATIGIIIILFVNKFIGTSILLALALKILGQGIIPMSFHYEWVIIFPLIILASIIFISKYLQQKTALIISFALIAIIICGQINIGTSNYTPTRNNSFIDNEINKMLYSSNVNEVYPVILLKNKPSEIIEKLKFTDEELKNDQEICTYVYHRTKCNITGFPLKTITTNNR